MDRSYKIKIKFTLSDNQIRIIEDREIYEGKIDKYLFFLSTKKITFKSKDIFERTIFVIAESVENAIEKTKEDFKKETKWKILTVEPEI